jgi:dTDP-4-dehydrorhamnose reductase
MKILLLGYNGQLGSDILSYLRLSGKFTKITTLGRDKLDVSDLDVLASKLKDLEFDVLINCTSIHKTDDIELDPTLAFTVNARAVKLMAEVTSEKKAKFYHISTDYVFGGYDYHDPITEDASCSPLNVYGASKFLGEQLAKIANKETYIFRVASLFGVQGASGKGGNFIETMIRLFGERDFVKVVEDQIMSPTFTADVAEVLCKSLLTKISPGIYHVVNGGSTSWHGLAEYVAGKVNYKGEVMACTSLEFNTVAMRPTYSVLDNSKISGEIESLPNWRDAVDRYLAAKGHIRNVAT